MASSKRTSHGFKIPKLLGVTPSECSTESPAGHSSRAKKTIFEGIKSWAPTGVVKFVQKNQSRHSRDLSTISCVTLPDFDDVEEANPLELLHPDSPPMRPCRRGSALGASTGANNMDTEPKPLERKKCRGHSCAITGCDSQPHCPGRKSSMSFDSSSLHLIFETDTEPIRPFRKLSMGGLGVLSEVSSRPIPGASDAVRVVNPTA